MPSVATDALVLHAFDYLETSRIFRLATREYGVLSVLARGVRRSTSRFGSALDLFAEGAARLEMRQGRDLQTLTGFDVTRARPELANDMARFTAAAAMSEIVQRIVTEDHAPDAYEVLRAGLDRLACAAPGSSVGIALAALWELVAVLGFAPALEVCAVCHRTLERDGALAFSHAAGGVLCSTCAPRAGASRLLPTAARAALVTWTSGVPGSAVSELEGRSHQRLLREFLTQHLTDAHTLKAWAVWEQARWV